MSSLSAFNRIGSGPNSSLVTFRTDKGPSAPCAPPTNLRVTNLSSTYSEITWDPIPSQNINAATLLGYEVFWEKVLNSTVNVTRAIQTTVWLTELEEDTDYNVIISAFNRIGGGPNSSLFTFRIEKVIPSAIANSSRLNTTVNSTTLSTGNSTSNGNLFDLRRLKAKTKILTEFIREAQYADDIAIFSDTPEGLQSLLTSYSVVAKRTGLCINTVKTETLCIGNTAEFFVDGTKLANVDLFKYLGSYVSSDCSMNEELVSRIQATSCAFGRLRKRVFDSHNLTAPTKVAVYNQCLMPLLMYGSETWTLYQHEVRQLGTIQQRHLRLILNIKWDDYISNEEVLPTRGH
ncbi:Protein sidekick-1 [Stylophora pistillata]|uniref:Protein sidekick-1 n=1 Tax=Stylophora pistillata TaxID=50429 RepID=A0A2B4SKZ7_STYPI|nr:Protein sidekick-1 [Stylophora pistillata]